MKETFGPSFIMSIKKVDLFLTVLEAGTNNEINHH